MKITRTSAATPPSLHLMLLVIGLLLAPPVLLGTVTPMKGRQYGATPDGMSRVYHYEITGGGRVDYRYNKEYRVSGSGDVHQIVQIVLVSLGSH